MFVAHRVEKRSANRTARMLTALLLALIGLAPAPSFAGGECQRVILSGDPAYPPFSWHEEGRLHGAAIDIAAIALTRIHLPFEVRYVGPFPRVLASAKSGEVDLVAELKNNPERQSYLDFSKTAIFVNPIAIFVRNGKHLPYKEWKDLVGLRGGITLGNKFGGGFDEFLSARLTVETAYTVESNFAKLSADRIDYFVTGYYPGLAYLIHEHKEDDFEVLHPFVTATDNFVGWSKASPCIGRLADFDAALALMVQSGEVKRILETNLAHLRSPRSPQALAYGP